MRIILSLTLFTTCTTILAQKPVSNFQYSIDSAHLNNYYVIHSPDQEKHNEITSSGRYIVRFKEISNGRSGDIHSQFQSDLETMSGAVNARTSESKSKIHFNYKNTFNGAAFSSDAQTIKALKKLDYISYISEDKKIKVNDDQSNSVIRANQVWSDYGSTGKNIRIGIIDTGIDYNHPDLGGGFGPSFKVIGGYDFVNEDSDPMDDYGHGTHVAGITAANGPGLKGVAPDAKLIAYKVLSSDGYGYDSWILAAIERTIDPDQNPETDDHLDVVNMSLGGQAGENDPLSEAVNNAVDQGVIFIVAAGNSYSYETIGSPGVAEKAITVGASDNFDVIASFSSKGPTAFAYRAKPDLVAPGVDINSTFMGGSYKSFSGTSMATPHVTGAVALLLELHPDWTADEIKSALMQSSKDLFQDLFTQGSGRMNIYEAISADFALVPGSISIGVIDKENVFANSYPISIHNFKSATQDIQFTLEGDFNQAGVTASLNSTQLSLSASAETDIQLNLTIDPGSLPINNYPESYVGYIVASNGTKTVRLAVSFMNPYSIELDFGDELPGMVIVSSNPETANYFRFVSPSASKQKLLLPAGKYDITSQYFPEHWVFKEAVPSNSTAQLIFRKEQADNRIIFKPVDENNKEISTSLNGNLFVGGKFSFTTLYFYPPDTLYVSDVSDNYIFEYTLSDFSDAGKSKFYTPTITLADGVNEGVTASNLPDYLPITFDFPHTSSTYGFTNFTNLGYWTTWNTYPIPLTKNITFFSHKRSSKSVFNQSSVKFSALSNSPDFTWETAGMAAYENDVLSFKNPYGGEFFSLQNQNEFSFKLGESLIKFDGELASFGTELYLNPIISRGFFVRSLGEKERGLINYEFKSGNTVLQRDTISNKLRTDYNNAIHLTNVNPGPYTLSLRYEDYQVHGKFGKATADIKFNTASSDKTAPMLKTLMLLSHGMPTDIIATGQSAILNLTAADQCTYGCDGANTGVGSMSVKIKKITDTDWTNLVLTQSNAETAQTIIPSSLAEGYYSLSVMISDLSGNSTEFTSEPAFLVGPPTYPIAYAKPILITPANNDDDVAINSLFLWSTVPQATGYVIQISKEDDFQNFEEHIVTIPQFKSLNNLEPDTEFYWRVKATVNQNATPWSITSTFTTSDKVAGHINLTAPPDGNVNQPYSVSFRWETEEGDAESDQYRFQLSTDSLFTHIIREDTTSLKVISLLVKLPKTNFFWRVITLRDDIIDMQWSSTFRFTTPDALIYLNSPSDKAANVNGTEKFLWSATPAPDHYIFQISETEDFGALLNETKTILNFISLSEVKENTTYFWKVKAQYSNEVGFWSSLFSFDTNSLFTGLEEENQELLSVYPNPTSREVFIKTSSQANNEIVVMDGLGRKLAVFPSTPQAEDGRLIIWNLLNLQGVKITDGIYTVTLRTENGPVSKKLIVLENN